jgi:imidazolonepropionase-like amidohydrolase
MAGWTPTEVVARSPLAMHIDFPEREGGGGFGGGGQSQEQVDAQLETLRQWMHRARAHAGALAAEMTTATDQTYTLDALVPVVLGELPVVLDASSEEGIKSALAFIEEFQLRGILAGTRDIWKVVDEIAKAGVPVILGPIQSQPADGDPYDTIFVAAKLLHEAGIPFAFRTGGATAARNLPDHAALGVAFGLPREAAWHALTRGAAEILGVGHLYGSVEEGMIANLVISDGDLLDIPSQVKHVLIRGQEAPLGTHHTRLWEQYSARPQPKQ